MADKRKPTWRAAANREVRIEDLPKGLQESIMRGIFGAAGGWIVMSGYQEADLGRKLSILRRVQNMSQLELAKKAGVSQADVSRAEKNYSQVRVETLAKIADALKVTLPALFEHSKAPVEGISRGSEKELQR